jgi:hypothetical protein
MSQRDDFSEHVKRALAARVGNLCSNPDCRALTSGPHEDAAKAVNLGVAAHITAAAPSGPRYDASLTPEQRAAIENAIWLCQSCAKLIDSDPVRFPVTLLLDWKSMAEAEARTRLGKAAVPPKADEAPLEGILEPGTSTLPKHPSPAALLNARHEIVRFHGRADVLEELRGWCEADGVAAARLIYGPGGMGKTRLLIELCRQMREKEWRAGFVPKRLDPARFAELVASERPTLVVIDYAESRPSLRELLAPVLRRRNAGGGGRMRVVLLSRTNGDWWEAALRSEVADLLRDEEPRALSPLVAEGEERRAVFQEAVQRFAEQRGRSAVQGPVPELGDPRYDRVLYVHMAALATVDRRAFTAATLMEDTLDHEEQFWVQKFEPKRDLDERLLRRKIRRVVAALTLRGGAADEAEAAALVERVGEAPDEALALFLRDLYRGGAVERAAYLACLEPDILGEAMVYRALKLEGTGVATLLDRTLRVRGHAPSAVGSRCWGGCRKIMRRRPAGSRIC